MFDIKFEKKKIKSFGDKTIFESAQENSLLIEHSCLTGRCSSCKAKLLSGTTVAIGGELGLTEDEKSQGYILTCVRQPKSDIELDVDILENVNFIKSKTIPSKISSITQVAPEVMKLVLRFPPNTEFKFNPGQYVNILKGNIKRSYSIAGQQDGNSLVFFIKKYEDGKMSKYLFEEAMENDLLRVEGPLGSFFLRETSSTNIIFLATGTGIAPVLSMIQNSASRAQLENKNVFLFHGGRSKEDLIEYPFFKQSAIHYFPTLSRSEEVDYHFGYIQTIVLSEQIDLKQSTVYACGSEKMIKEAKSLLVNNGLNPKEFYSDAFLESN